MNKPRCDHYPPAALLILLPILLCLALAAASCGSGSDEGKTERAAVQAKVRVPAPGPAPGQPTGTEDMTGDLAELFNQAGELARTGHYDRSLEFYQKILDVQPDHPPTLVNAARCHFISGRTEEAILLLQRANEAVPGHARTLGYLGMAEAKADRLEDALIHLEGSQLLDPSQIDVGNDLAGVYFRLERYPEAEEAWNRVLKQDSDNAEAQAGLEQVVQKSRAES